MSNDSSKGSGFQEKPVLVSRTYILTITIIEFQKYKIKTIYQGKEEEFLHVMRLNLFKKIYNLKILTYLLINYTT